ncbi:MAG: methyltransferase domain-containing protein [Anaerolineae bacterium]|nr:methyltransferase domain-containing protein [Anaerolineae bacterium]
MSESKQDIWAEWLLHRRFGGDKERMKSVLADFLYPVRDKVLSNANLGEGETLLDVGCGDGLIGFGALEKSPTSKVIFSDISQDLLDHAQSIADEMQVQGRCTFLRASAEDLTAVSDASIDVVTTRSVLIYVPAKQKAFNEFFRVLKPQGRLSIFEPINRFGWPEPRHLYIGYDITPVIEIADKLKALYHRLQPSDSDPMLDFDERDLIVFAERAGFKEVYLELRVEVKPPTLISSWETFLHLAGNPKIPTLEEAMNQTLTPDETERFTAHLRPLVDSKQGTTRSALAYLWASKN